MGGIGLAAVDVLVIGGLPARFDIALLKRLTGGNTL